MACETCAVAPAPCVGESLPHLCGLAAAHPHWRRHVAERSARLGQLPAPAPDVPRVPAPAPRAPDIVALLEAVRTCPDRGGVLPLSEQPQGCCAGAELTACAAGKGAVPGRVTLDDCLGCRRAAAEGAPSP